MNKKQSHFEALGYEPLRMKPAHFASGFFIAVTDKVFANELLNKVAVTKTKASSMNTPPRPSWIASAATA